MAGMAGTDRDKRIALVTGANKGIGFEIARQLAEAGVHVLLGARDAALGRAAADRLASAGLPASYVAIDVRDPAVIAAAAARIEAEHGRLDILVNNAGISVAGDGAPGVVSLDVVRQTMETNFFGPLMVTQAMLPLLRKSGAGRIVNVSSKLGSLTCNNDPGYEGYNVRLAGYNTSKAALNMLTVQLNAELRGTGITAVSVCPGLTQTDLNGHMGNRPASQGAKAPVRLALATANDGLGLYQDENGSIPW